MAMNLSRKLAEGRKLLHPLIVLRYSLYSTTRPKSTRKQHKPDIAASKLVTQSTSESHDTADVLGDHHERSPAAPMLSQKDAKLFGDWPRPSEIPWQAKVANSVNIIGSVAIPVQFQASPDGKYSAGTILTQERTPNRKPIWIPLIFEDDLAHVAACHLKEKDLIHVVGHLIGDSPPFSLEQGQSSIQVMVDNLSFVQESHSWKESHALYKQDQQTSNFSDGIIGGHLWNDLLANPHLWCDCRLHKSDPNDADFKHKDSSQLLWINKSTPIWILSKLESLTFHHKADQESQKNATAEPKGSSMDNMWRDLVANPNLWWDNRKAKLQGLVNPKYPDFKNKDSRQGLWIDTAPAWALLKLEELGFDNGPKTNQGKESKDNKEEQPWKDLVENPDKWWDNRSSKLNARGPDFKHKETGKGLWIDRLPGWVLDQLPPVKSINVAVGGKDALS